jgi:predicted oxidoreductase
VLENKVLRRISGPKMDEITRESRKLHSEDFHNLYSSANIISYIKSRGMRLAGHVAHTWRGGKSAQDFGGKALRKKTTWKTEA